MYIYKIRIDTKVSGLHKYVIFCHFQNRQTPRGSGVRIPQRPQKEVKKGLASFFMS